jgi:hypothetical protein
VQKRAEGAPDYVCVLYASDCVTPYPAGTVLKTYYPSTPDADADIHVAVVDATDAYLTTSLAGYVGQQYFAWYAANLWEGTVTVTDTITRVDGAVVPASWIRAGQWVECSDILGHEPLYVTQCEYDAGSKTAVLTIGTSEEFVNPLAGRNSDQLEAERHQRIRRRRRKK